MSYSYFYQAAEQFMLCQIMLVSLQQFHYKPPRNHIVYNRSGSDWMLNQGYKTVCTFFSAFLCFTFHLFLSSFLFLPSFSSSLHLCLTQLFSFSVQNGTPQEKNSFNLFLPSAKVAEMNLQPHEAGSEVNDNKGKLNTPLLQANLRYLSETFRKWSGFKNILVVFQSDLSKALQTQYLQSVASCLLYKANSSQELVSLIVPLQKLEEVNKHKCRGNKRMPISLICT